MFDHFVFDQALHEDSVMLENAATQCLLLSGFLARQMAHRHSRRW